MQKKALTILLAMVAAVAFGSEALAGTATLAWDPNTETDLAGYKVYYGTASGSYALGPIDVGLTSTPASPQYTVNNLTEGQTYYFAVTAYDTSGNESGFSNEVSKLITDVTPPVISAIAAINITSTGAVITWTTNEAATSQVEYGTTTNYGSFSTLNSTLTTSHSRTLGSLAPNTTYHFRVINKDAAGNTATSGDNTFATSPPPTTTTTTSAPTTTTNPTTTTTSAPTTTTNPQGTTTTLTPTTTTLPTTTTTRATTTTTLSTTTTTMPPPPADTTPPMTVSEFQADVGDGQIQLSWQNPPDPDLQGVRIRYRTDGTFPTHPQDGELVGDFTGQPLSNITYVHLDLFNDTAYYYSAFAYDTSGNYSQAFHVQATPTASTSQNSDSNGKGLSFGCGTFQDFSGGSGPTAGQAALNLIPFILLFILIKMQRRLAWRRLGES